MNSFESSFFSQLYTKDQNQQPCFGVTIPEKQFKRTENADIHSSQKITFKMLQFHQKMTQIKVQFKIKTIFNILYPKLINIKQYAFQNIKKNIQPQDMYLQKVMKEIMILNSIDQVQTKVDNFVKKQKINLLSKGFDLIRLQSLAYRDSHVSKERSKNKITSKRESSSIVRGNSKLDSSLHVSDLDVDISNKSPNNNPQAKNKKLKKQKQKFQKNFNAFYSVMDQILTTHEQYLKKK